MLYLYISFFSLEPAFWVGKNSLRCWRKLVLEEIEGVKGKGYSEEDSSLNCMEIGGLYSSNYDNKMSCENLADTCDENMSDEEKALQQNAQKIPVKCKGYSDVRIECESSSISLNSEGCESTVGMATQLSSKITSKSDNEKISLDLLETHTSESLPVLSCNISTDNSQISSCDSGRNMKILPPGLRRTFVSDKNNSNSEAENIEMEVSSTVPLDCEESQNLKSLQLAVCNNSAITSSDEISASHMHDCKIELSEITGEGTSIPRQEVAISKDPCTSSNNNISGDNVSQICTENVVEVLELKPSYVRIRTPGFGDDIIQSVEEVAMCEKFTQKSNKQPQDVTCESDGMVQENTEESEVKTDSDVLSGDATMDDETLHNGQQMETQKQDDNLLCKDSDEQEEDEEGFNEDIICTHGMLNFKLTIIPVPPLKTLSVTVRISLIY